VKNVGVKAVAMMCCLLGGVQCSPVAVGQRYKAVQAAVDYAEFIGRDSSYVRE